MNNSRKIGQEKMVLRLYDLVLDEATTAVEREILVSAKNKLEEDGYYPRVINDLEIALRPQAIRSELSEKVKGLYMDISTIGKFEKELGRGLASTPITFGK